MGSERTPDVPGGVLPPERVLSEVNARAYRRFIEWSLGHGFKLGVIEVTEPWKRDALVAWAKSVAPGTRVMRLDQADRVPLRYLLDDLAELPGEMQALVLTHLEEAPNRRQVCAQLNVQRDDLARAFPVPWLVLVHPYASLEFQLVAPDFVDFAGLWLHEEDAASTVRGEVPSLGGSLMATTPWEPLNPRAPGSDLLHQALEATRAGRFDEARDRLAQHKLMYPQGVDSVDRLRVEGELLWSTGRLGEARAIYERMLHRCEADGDERGISSASHQLGLALHALGDLAAARHAFERSLTVKNKVYGAGEHASVAESLHELARVLRATGDTKAARQLLERVIDIKTKLYGAGDHPSVAESLHELARVLRAMGDTKAARQLLERVLVIKTKLYGTDEHPAIATSLHELAGVMLAQGDPQAARPLIERSLAIKLKIYGTDEHPSVAASLNELGSALHALGDLRGARELFERAIAIQERLYGSRDHYDTAITEWNVAVLLREMGERQRARHLLEHAHKTLIAKLGPDHPYTKQVGELLKEE